MAIPSSFRNLALVLLLVALVPLAATSPQRVQAQTASANPIVITAVRGESGTTQFSVNFPLNSGATPITYNLTAIQESPSAPGITTSIFPGSITLQPNDSGARSFSVTAITQASTPLGRYSFSLSVSTTAAPNKIAAIDITVTAQATPTNTPTLTPTPSVTPTPTQTATATTTPTATPGPICPEGARDPGNDFGSAKLVLVDTPNNHGICTQGDEDWFKFAAIGGKVYTLDITRFDPGLDLIIELYDADGQRLAVNDDYPARTPPPASAGNLTPVPTRDIAPRVQSWRSPRDGIYYVRIRDTGGIGGANKTYTFVVFSESYGPTPPTVPEICRDLFEEDGLPEEAKLITSNEVQPNRRICPTGDADWVKFFGKTGKIYYIYTDTRPYRNNPAANPSNQDTQAGADTIMFLTDRDGATILDYNDDIEGPDGSSLDSQIRFVPSADGFYFVQVKNTGDIGNQYLRYDIVLTLCAPGRDDCGRARSPVNTQPTAAPAPTATPASFDRTPTLTLTVAPTATPIQFLEQSQQNGMVNGPVAGFADRAFETVWRRTDALVASGRVSRSWMWGPKALMARSEGYLQAAGGLRQVQYFDKGRMEVSDPNGDRNSQWFVTSGLLAVELVSGRMQVGNQDFAERGAATVPVAGDSTDPNGPTYASFAGLLGKPGSDRTGRIPQESINRAGELSAYTGTARPETALAMFVPQTGHNIPQVFWQFLTSQGEIEEAGQRRSGFLMDWVFTMGYPVTEPYWARVQVGGQQRDVLIQIFERRVLTYDPANSAQWRVEMGNIGRHYYRWRYGEELPTP